MLKRFSTKDLIIIALLSGLGIAVKPLISPLIKMVSAPLMLPGGSLAGGFYMMWLTLAIALVPRFGTGLLFGIVQAISIFALGWFGNHGALSLISYTLPGLLADIVALAFKRKSTLWCQITLCAIANLTGALIMAAVIFRLPMIPMLVSASTAIASGALGGFLAYLMYVQLYKLRLL
ncbi:MAG: hypothetical protein CVU48_04765 [Candidatus Cloacimonetes bacterium HGW-Cloacimonetes-1]|jgi:energy-coupling factor transport system substrate-specific component|nr:MAG: hypothetical protein CVU48_04765 [Candidatus Cloacimonetes bacterium HGW-Cloacimonetes-1]